LGAKRVDDVRAKLDVESDAALRMRLMFDLLGEAYDDWRHALEERRKITMTEDVWSTYEKLLQFLQTAPISAGDGAV
jgi:DNA-binding helix-hairpin-helix protein with protein kinase domain